MSCTFDISPYLKPGDPFVEETGMETVLQYYDFKHSIARLLRPKSILEIGVRAGYSAAAFLAASPEANYVGLDADKGRYGGVVGYTDWAVESLRRHFPAAQIAIHTFDTQLGGYIDGTGTFDLVYVDGDHSENGCYNDMCLGERLGRWVLVDDVDYAPGVTRGVKRWLEERPWHQHVHFQTFRGDVLIRVTRSE